MAIHEEPNGGEGGRAVADHVPISSLFGAEAISSVGNKITTLAVLGGPLVDRLGVLVEPLLDLRRACPGWSC